MPTPTPRPKVAYPPKLVTNLATGVLNSMETDLSELLTCLRSTRYGNKKAQDLQALAMRHLRQAREALHAIKIMEE